MSDKIYLNGLIIKARQNQFGEEELKVSIKVDELIKELQEHKDERGWVNLEIRKKKTASDKGVTHYTIVDTWKPTQGGERAPQATGTGSNEAPAFYANDTDNDLPF